MKPLFPSQSVRYVNSSDATVDAIIQEVVGQDMAHVKHGDNAIALAKYSEGKEKNTFHFPEESGDSPVPSEPPAESTSKKPFKPGAKAGPEKTKTTGVKTPATTA